MTVPILHERKRKKTTSSSRRPPARRRSPGPGPPNQSLPASLPLLPPSPPRRTCRRMKWSTHSRCVSCHSAVYSGSSYISKWGVQDLVLGMGWVQSGKNYRTIYSVKKKKKRKSKTAFQNWVKTKKKGNYCPFTIERAIMDNKGKKK